MQPRHASFGRRPGHARSGRPDRVERSVLAGGRPAPGMRRTRGRPAVRPVHRFQYLARTDTKRNPGRTMAPPILTAGSQVARRPYRPGTGSWVHAHTYHLVGSVTGSY